MTINALFPSSMHRDSRSASSAQTGGADTSFAAMLAASTGAVERARESTAQQASAASSGTSATASASGASKSDSTNESLGADARPDAIGAADGITITYQPIGGRDAPLGSSASSLAQALSNAGQGSDPSKPVSDTLSKSSFESLIEKFGGTQAQADQLFSMLGGDENGTVSNAQMLKALGNTLSDPSSQTSQMLMTLMDRNGDQLVSGGEFIQFETAMVNTERGTSV